MNEMFNFKCLYYRINCMIIYFKNAKTLTLSKNNDLFFDVEIYRTIFR